MAWVSPSTVATGDPITAALWNTYVRDNSIDLDRRSTVIMGFVATSETTTSTTYVDLATVGPAAVVTVGANLKVVTSVYCHILNTLAASISRMSWAISGGTTSPANDAVQLVQTAPFNNSLFAAGTTVPQVMSAAGSTTFTAKYKTDTGTATFAARYIMVTPLSA